MKYISVLLLLVVFATTLLAQVEKNKYPFKEKYSSDENDCDLDADIELDNLNLEAGKQYSVKYAINAGAFCRLYNPFFTSLITSPGQLAFYDENKKYISNLTKKIGGSSARISEASWANITGGSPVKSQKIFIVRKNFSDDSSNLQLEEGTYYLQLIFYKGIISSPPEFLEPELDLSNFYKTFSTAELFRSNAIKINIVKAK